MDDGSITQANPEGGNYVFQNDWFSETNYKGRKIPCISKEAQLLFHSGYDLTEKDHFDIKNLKINNIIALLTLSLGTLLKTVGFRPHLTNAMRLIMPLKSE